MAKAKRKKQSAAERLLQSHRTAGPHRMQDALGTPDGQIAHLPVDQIDADPGQPRKTFDEAELGELQASIEEKDVQQPIGVRPVGDRYTIIWGERRWRASKLAKKGTIPVIVRQVDEDEAYELAMIENIQREDLSPVEEAVGLQTLRDRRGYTQEQLAKVVGRSQTQVSQLLSINKIPQRLRDHYSTSNISRDHWFQVVQIRDEDEQEGLLETIVQDSLTVRGTREAVKAAKKGKKAVKPKDPTPPLVRDMRRIREKLGKELPGKWKAADKEALRQEIAAWREQLEKLEGGL